MKIKLTVIVSASSKKPRIEKNLGIYKFYLKSAPIEGKANIELVKTLSLFLNISPSCIKIIQGKTSKKKILEIDFQNTTETFFEKLDAQLAKT